MGRKGVSGSETVIVVDGLIFRIDRIGIQLSVPLHVRMGHASSYWLRLLGLGFFLQRARSASRFATLVNREVVLTHSHPFY